MKAYSPFGGFRLEVRRILADGKWSTHVYLPRCLAGKIGITFVLRPGLGRSKRLRSGWRADAEGALGEGEPAVRLNRARALSHVHFASSFPKE